MSLEPRLGPGTRHLSVDMQRLFAEEGPWPTPWLPRVLPNIVRLVERAPDRTIFTRFVPPATPDEMPGRWKAYYERWRGITREAVDPALIDLLPELARFVPPARVFDKPVYSAFAGRRLQAHLAEIACDGLVVTGGESDVCVLATVLGAVDAGYPVHVVSDALCSSADETHDAVMTLFRDRFSQQIAVISTDELLDLWP
ncbi:nicotinamidase-related amidase [Prosthecomicrobium pneumaticum]|uniref:Nicotinamidase-related amidase n=1 Tax=Prosthecomicrobium pneumaticum TaxID=81895 RepID=A0A7W9FPI1_9HYPH|nr:nicotinamidase-related amidase [Prosthecomicrobium pneumaticum]